MEAAMAFQCRLQPPTCEKNYIFNVFPLSWIVTYLILKSNLIIKRTYF